MVQWVIFQLSQSVLMEDKSAIIRFEKWQLKNIYIISYGSHLEWMMCLSHKKGATFSKMGMGMQLGLNPTLFIYSHNMGGWVFYGF